MLGLLLASCGVIKPLPADHPIAGHPVAGQPPGQPTETPPPGGPQGEPLPQLENTFAHDDRQLVTSTEYPWSTVGRLNTGCTATLIDRRAVITAAHCIYDPDGRFLASHFAFSPNMIGGRSAVSVPATYVWYGTRTPLRTDPSDFVDDWAVLLLAHDLGVFGALDARDVTPNPGDVVTLVGYSADVDAGLTATTHVDCRIQSGAFAGQLTHDCDMTRGASGGPLWSYAWGQVPAIVAINSSEYRDGGEVSLKLGAYDGVHPNGAVPAHRFFPAVKWVVDHY